MNTKDTDSDISQKMKIPMGSLVFKFPPFFFNKLFTLSPRQNKISLFVEMREMFGRTALLLSGGGGLGVFHFGILKVH